MRQLLLNKLINFNILRKELLTLFLVSISVLTFAQTSHWKLIWHDEFSKNGQPDTSKWNFAGRGKSAWNCYCYNDTTTAVVKDGRLLLSGIVTKNEADTVHYQTGCITTRGKFYFKYGKLVVRAKLPQAQGSWPAIWLLPETNIHGGWPEGGEIDVMEHLNHDRFIYQTMHSYYIDRLHHKRNPKDQDTAYIHSGAFNNYGIAWYPDRIDFFVNGCKTFSYPKLKTDTTGTQWPFDQPFYILLDQALGGWPGKINDQELPVAMEVDWIRVYQSDQGDRSR